MNWKKWDDCKKKTGLVVCQKVLHVWLKHMETLIHTVIYNAQKRNFLSYRPRTQPSFFQYSSKDILEAALQIKTHFREKMTKTRRSVYYNVAVYFFGRNLFFQHCTHKTFGGDFESFQIFTSFWGWNIIYKKRLTWDDSYLQVQGHFFNHDQFSRGQMTQDLNKYMFWRAK